MKKSQTGVVLPTINSKAKFGSQLRQIRLSSCFVQKVKQEVSKEEEYQVMDDSRLGEQQQKLKRLLRDFNDHSQFVLANFIDGPLRSSRTQSLKKNQSVQAKQKQFTVLSKMMQQCQSELRVLQGRCQNLKYLTREQMQRQISQVTRQIESLRTENKELSREVTLNGLNFTRAEKNGQVKDLQSEKLQVQLKKAQLQTNSDEAVKELQAFKQKFLAQEKQAAEKELQFKQAIQIQLSLTNAERLKQQRKQKKRLIEQMSQRNQQHSGVIKQKYFTRLRQLEELTGNRKKTDQQIGKKQILLQKTKKELIILEHQLSALKHGATTIQLLQTQAKKT